MPIYAYRCADCGHAKDVLQKMSDAPLTDCPACGHASFSKQVTAAGFQLKGSGWYVTDFRGSATTDSGSSSTSVGGESAVTAPAPAAAAPASTESSSSNSSSAGSCSTGCACH